MEHFTKLMFAFVIPFFIKNNGNARYLLVKIDPGKDVPTTPDDISKNRFVT